MFLHSLHCVHFLVWTPKIILYLSQKRFGHMGRDASIVLYMSLHIILKSESFWDRLSRIRLSTAYETLEKTDFTNSKILKEFGNLCTHTFTRLVLYRSTNTKPSKNGTYKNIYNFNPTLPPQTLLQFILHHLKQAV